MRRLYALIATFSLVSVCSNPILARESNQLKAALTKYFIQNHYAIPLMTNGSVKSGDVIKLPEEATVLSRDTCYNLPKPQYRYINAAKLDGDTSAALSFGMSSAIYRLISLDAALGGGHKQTSSVNIDPLSQEEPQDALYKLVNPKQTDSKCLILKQLIGREVSNNIIVSRVLHGVTFVRTLIEYEGQADADAKIALSKLNVLLGTSPTIHVGLKGSHVEVTTSQSPSPRSVAVQSALISPEQLLAIHLKLDANSAVELESLVRGYIRGKNPDELTKFQILIADLLNKLGFKWIAADQLYEAVFSGTDVIPVPPEKIPEERWRSFGLVAAGYEAIRRVPSRQ